MLLLGRLQRRVLCFQAQECLQESVQWGGTRLFQNTLPVLTSPPQFQWHPLSTEVAHLGGVLQLPLHALDAEVILTQIAAVPVGPGVQQVSTKSRTALIIKTRK